MEQLQWGANYLSQAEPTVARCKSSQGFLKSALIAPPDPQGRVNIPFGLHDLPVITQTAQGPYSVPGWKIWLADFY